MLALLVYKHAQLSAIQRHLIYAFFNEPAGTTNLHEASTYRLDINVRRRVLQLEDRELPAKLSAGDMIALEAKYHRNCLTRPYNKPKQITDKQE